MSKQNSVAELLAMADAAERAAEKLAHALRDNEFESYADLADDAAFNNLRKVRKALAAIAAKKPKR